MSYDGRIYTVSIGSVRRDLPIFRITPGVNIAIFNMLGDTEMVEMAAGLLLERLPASTQVLVVPEVKAVPLGHALSLRSGLPLVVVRKLCKPYMTGCLEAEVLSITTGRPQTLYLDGKDLPLVRSRKAVLVDDVISTGSTLKGMRLLMGAADAEVIGEMAVFTEGDAADWMHVTALGHLPVFADTDAAAEPAIHSIGQ